MAQKWEYKFLRLIGEFDRIVLWYEDDKKIAPPTNALARVNQLGDEGWELVSATTFNSGGYEFLQHWYKRPKN